MPLPESLETLAFLREVFDGKDLSSPEGFANLQAELALMVLSGVVGVSQADAAHKYMQLSLTAHLLGDARRKVPQLPESPLERKPRLARKITATYTEIPKLTAVPDLPDVTKEG